MSVHALRLGWLAVLLASSSGCKCGPCIPVGEYELFARRISLSGSLDGGASNCPVELTMSLRLTSANAAHFTIDSGVEGDCVLDFYDYRQKYDCQAVIQCNSASSAPQVTFRAFAFTRPEYEFIGDNQAGLGFHWRDTPDAGCDAVYSWAAAARRPQ